LIKNSGLMGYGINNSTKKLTECYNQKVGSMSVLSIEKYNSHNQFLETTIGMGIVGGLILLSIYSIIIITGIKRMDYMILFYFIIVFSFGITESFLVRQWGLAFFSFFTPFLLNRQLNSKNH